MICDRTVVEVTNADIRKLGLEKVAILQRIKNINYMHWQRNFMEEQSNNLTEHYTDLQLLRVTKHLQAFIKGGDSVNQNKVDMEKAEAKLVHMQGQHQAKMRKLQVACSKLSRQHQEKAGENERLAGQIGQLETNVAMRESIYRSRFDAGGGGGGAQSDPAVQAKNRMRTITMRRKLIDLARAQTDEIEFLRQELDRLRQRTFPRSRTRQTIE